MVIQAEKVVRKRVHNAQQPEVSEAEYERQQWEAIAQNHVFMLLAAELEAEEATMETAMSY